MDFYAYGINYVAPLPFLTMTSIRILPNKTFPWTTPLNYILEYNTRHMSRA